MTDPNDKRPRGFRAASADEFLARSQFAQRAKPVVTIGFGPLDEDHHDDLQNAARKAIRKIKRKRGVEIFKAMITYENDGGREQIRVNCKTRENRNETEELRSGNHD